MLFLVLNKILMLYSNISLNLFSKLKSTVPHILNCERTFKNLKPVFLYQTLSQIIIKYYQILLS